MDLENAVRVELAYRVSKHMAETGVTIEEFADNCDVPVDTVTMALDRSSIPLSNMVEICDTLGILLDNLRYPPRDDPRYIELSSRLLSICSSKSSPGAKRKAAFLEREKSALDAQTWRRYVTWLEYEVTCAKMEEEQNYCKHKKHKRLKVCIPIQHFASAAFIRKISPKRERWLKSIIEEFEKK